MLDLKVLTVFEPCDAKIIEILYDYNFSFLQCHSHNILSKVFINLFYLWVGQNMRHDFEMTPNTIKEYFTNMIMFKIPGKQRLS